MFRVLAYRRTQNLGDAFQTVAISRLLGPRIRGVYRDLCERVSDDGVPFVVNGWIGESAPTAQRNTLFAGVFLGKNPEPMREWIVSSAFPVGSRDPHTLAWLESSGIRSELCRCATLTFERYTGPRRGIFTVDSTTCPDSHRAKVLTQLIPSDLPWPNQWGLALGQLALLRTAELVYTSRLHVILPCLAFGTPVFASPTELSRASQPERFSILRDLGFRFGEACELDVSRYSENYIHFLGNALNMEIRPRQPVYPEPLYE